ncbi:hypothetical protein [Vibrio aestuarianus]|nr:hypothetical protein [Vibrio aestuarianus]
MSKLIDAGKEVLGTGREAKENFNYDQLVKNTISIQPIRLSLNN